LSSSSWSSSSSSSVTNSFNPFDYNAQQRNSNSNQSRSSGAKIVSRPHHRIYLRQTRMQQLVHRLLEHVHDPVATQQILTDHADFLLEPLEDYDNAVLDYDDDLGQNRGRWNAHGTRNIFRPGMDRAERYRAYRASLQERVALARSPQVRTVLQAMQDFVLSME
jgi:hypothetical protein